MIDVDQLTFCQIILAINDGQLSFFGPIINLVIKVDQQTFCPKLILVINVGQLTSLSNNLSCDKCRSTYFFVQLLIL